MKNIDIQRIEDFIKALGEDELIYINRLVIERLKLISQMKSTNQMIRFNIGERVTFKDHENKIKKGTIIKLNKKTVSINTDDAQIWNVPPGILKHL